jgi:hypothetical protein
MSGLNRVRVFFALRLYSRGPQEYNGNNAAQERSRVYSASGRQVPRESAQGRNGQRGTYEQDCSRYLSRKRAVGQRKTEESRVTTNCFRRHILCKIVIRRQPFQAASPCAARSRLRGGIGFSLWGRMKYGCFIWDTPPRCPKPRLPDHSRLRKARHGH